MRSSDRIIILSTTKFGENSVILHCLSKTYGRCGVMVKSAGRSMAFFQPLNILDCEVTVNPKSTLLGATGFSSAHPLCGIRSNFAKNAISMFVAEVLFRAVQEGDVAPGVTGGVSGELSGGVSRCGSGGVSGEVTGGVSRCGAGGVTGEVSGEVSRGMSGCGAGGVSGEVSGGVSRCGANASDGNPEDEGLFDWCVSEILLLDALDSDFANFHLRFLMDFAAALGFHPTLEALLPFLDGGSYGGNRQGLVEVDGCCRERDDCRGRDDRSQATGRGLVEVVAAMLSGDFADSMLVRLTGAQRSDLCARLLKYLEAHIEAPLHIRSLAVLSELFA